MTYLMPLVKHVLPTLPSNFNELLKVVGPIGLALLLIHAAIAQPSADSWQQDVTCATTSNGAEASFEGLLVLDAPDDGWRALRSGFDTMYYLAFAGSNFLNGAAVSPDGSRYVVPYGTIVTAAQDDVRYVVNELRLVTTATVPRIMRRIPWSASFPVGTAFTTAGDIPRVRWLDNAQIAYPTGSMTAAQSWVVLDVDADNLVPLPSDLAGEPFVSPTFGRVLRRDGGGWTLSDGASRTVIARFGPLSTVVWSPNGASFAAVEQVVDGWTVGIYDFDGSAVGVAAQSPIERVPVALRWSPDSSKLAFSLLDPETNANALMVADLSTRSTRDVCVSIDAWPSGGIGQAAPLAWNPNSDALAVLVDGVIEIIDLTNSTRSRLGRVTGGLIGWFPGQ